MAEVVELWTAVQPSEVFRPVLLSGWSTAGAYGAELLRWRKPRVTGLLDTGPLQRLLQERVAWDRVRRNVASGFVRAVAVATTTSRGWTRVFVDASDGLRLPSPDDDALWTTTPPSSSRHT